MEHTNEILKRILREEYGDYDENNWHYDTEYRLLEKAFNKDIKSSLETSEDADKLKEENRELKECIAEILPLLNKTEILIDEIKKLIENK